ncbi:DUF805 domain-containing protein [Sphingomonas arenae]|uniref:DUF805 domain-containing protein n=1 Tax=Sphingomonas arenae TaxID=2812555 RepID=UPI0019671DBD|nr:DUF805 domain-containing protein [Sphingomonas arenae]
MTPMDWAMRPLKRFAEFSGRSPRAEYWWFYLGYIVLSVLLNIITNISAILGMVLSLASLVLIIPFIAVGVRRLHDIDRTGWWLLAPVVPYALGFAMIGTAVFTNPEGIAASGGFGVGMIFFGIGLILALVVFVFTLLPGTKGSNRYGPDPYGPDNLHEVFA